MPGKYKMQLDDIRREYAKEGLQRDMLLESPFDQFDLWIKQAIDSGLKDPTAMTLATVGDDGTPNQRIVLLKQSDGAGFVFYTNYGSDKAKDIAHNNRVSLHFPWHMVDRQVKIVGRAEKVSTAESLAYFVSRPRDSQLAAWASKQSARINSRQFLMSQFQSLKRKYSEGEVPLPDFWGGFRVVPEKIEFWQGRENRLHDRFRYSLFKDTWSVERLAP